MVLVTSDYNIIEETFLNGDKNSCLSQSVDHYGKSYLNTLLPTRLGGNKNFIIDFRQARYFTFLTLLRSGWQSSLSYLPNLCLEPNTRCFYIVYHNSVLHDTVLTGFHDFHFRGYYQKTKKSKKEIIKYTFLNGFKTKLKYKNYFIPVLIYTLYWISNLIQA